MSRKLVAILSVLTLVSLPLTAQEYPRLYVSDADRSSIVDKIESHDWARASFQTLVGKLTPYVERHKVDSEWIVSRLAMYWQQGERYTQCYLKNQNWDRGEGNAPVPTVRMPGMRTWNKYHNVALEERTPYNTTGDMWGIDRSNPSAPKVLVPYKESGHMIRNNNVEILTLAEEAAFLYWLTGEKPYAAFAADIYNTWLVGTYYMNPILDPESSTGSRGGYESGGICGYYDYEQIHDDLVYHAAVIYDFLHDYLQTHPHPHMAQIGKSVDEMTQVVFRRFVEIGLVRGGKSGNWNVNGWNMILRAILLLDNNEKYLHNLVEESSAYHDAIPDILTSYDPQTGLWPESPGYSFSVVNMLLEFSTLLSRRGIDIIESNPILERAAMAVFPWMDARGNMIVFGDSRGGAANFTAFEHMFAYYTKRGDATKMAKIAAGLNAGIESGAYTREHAGWIGLCTFIGSIDTPVIEVEDRRISFSEHHRLATMKEGSLMAVLYGGRNGYHLSTNGLALQLYGFGYALSPDASGYESYWSQDHHYHQSATGSNTILPGYTEGDVKLTISDESRQGVTVCQMRAGEKCRTVVMVGVGDNDGYYIDLFRSAQPENDYLFHNVGQDVWFEDMQGNTIPLTSREGFDKKHSPNYDWFTRVRSATYNAPFRAVWRVTDSISMYMFMIGVEGRELYAMDAPYTTFSKDITPDGVSSAPMTTPTIIVRQEGIDGWQQPFIALFQPCRNQSPSVERLEQLPTADGSISLCITMKSGRKDYLTITEGSYDFVSKHP